MGSFRRGSSEEPYGIEEGQRKPMWQEAIHKARVRLCRVPIKDSHLANAVDRAVSVFGLDPLHVMASGFTVGSC